MRCRASRYGLRVTDTDDDDAKRAAALDKALDSASMRKAAKGVSDALGAARKWQEDEAAGKNDK